MMFYNVWVTFVFSSSCFIISENESLISEEDCPTAVVEVDYPPGTKIKVRYGRQRNIKIYDAKVVEVKLAEDRTLLYSVHYAGWNNR